MADFKQAVQFVLRNEGGYSDHPRDRGGKTKYGISSASHPWIGDISRLTLGEAIDIYEREYWGRWNIGMLKDQNVATKMLDAVVLMGPKATFALQRALRAVGKRVVEDGVLGPETAGAANAYEGRQILPPLRSEIAGMLREIVVKKPAQGVFLRGWLERAYK